MEKYPAMKQKEQNWVSCSDVDESRAYYTAWSKSEREKYYMLMHRYEI